MINELEKQITHLSSEEQLLIKKAYYFSFEKHKEQKRRSGEPYINHPLRVAINLAKSKHGAKTIAASLLHDTVEDTDTTLEEIKEHFDDEVAQIVDGVTKISSIKIKSKDKFFSAEEEMFVGQVENYRKLLVAMAHDIRVIAIKLHDRLDNIMTLDYIVEHKRKFYARETIEIYAPIAERLGMGEIKGELEDLSFRYAYPEEYSVFMTEAKKIYKNPKKTVERVIPHVKKHLSKAGLRYIQISGRAKHLYSLYLKLKRKDYSLSNIFDIVALRIIVESVEDCYRTLGLLHSIYEPLPDTINDYIARPKDNGYQSLHTTVRDGKDIFEIQIRTEEMHRHAEDGSAAHWDYKDKTVGFGKKSMRSNLEWLEELKKIGNEYKQDKEFIETVKEEFFSERIFVFTPRGEIIDLPQGSTPLDFAFKIHTQLGFKCSGAKINGRLMPLNTALQTKDLVEIVTSNKALPSRNWLELVKTTYAKNKIKNYLRSQNKDLFYEEGKKLFLQLLKENNLIEPNKCTADEIISRSRLPFNTYSSALISIGEGSFSKQSLFKLLFPQESKQEKKKVVFKAESDVIESLKHIRHAYAGCCNPRKQDKKIGYLTKDHILKIHKYKCKRLESADSRRLFAVSDEGTAI